MKTFVAEISPDLLKYSQQLDLLLFFTNQNWVEFNNDNEIKSVFIFQDNHNLIISKNGIVEMGYWEHVGCNSLLIENTNTRLLFKQGFCDDSILALKLDGNNEYVFFINENKCKCKFNGIADIISYLESCYLQIKYSQIETCSRYFDKMNHKYKSPKYEVLKRYKSFSLLGGSFDVIKLKFADGLIGSIFNKKITGHSFFRSGHYIGSHYCTYRDFDSCVNGFHYYLTKKGALKKFYLNSILKRLLLTSGHIVNVGYWYPTNFSIGKLINI